MDRSKLVRDAEKVHAHLKELEDGSVIALKPCKLYIPARFAEGDLAIIAEEISIVGIFAMVVEDKYYGVCTANTMMRIEPSATSTVKIDDDDYLEFYFEAGARVLTSSLLVKVDTLTYHIYDEIIAKGRVPWYLSYEDLAKLFESAEYHAGVKIGANHAIMEMIAAVISRDDDDRTKYYRHTVTKLPSDKPPAIVPLRNISYGASNTTAKLMGAYFQDGLTSALINPSERVEKVEELLRR